MYIGTLSPEKRNAAQEETQASAYEACDRTRTPLHTTKTRLKHQRRAKKSTPCLIKKASRCAADCTPKTTTLFIFQRAYEKLLKILRENHAYSCLFFICRSVLFFTQRTTDSDRLKRNMNNGTIVFLTLTSSVIALT